MMDKPVLGDAELIERARALAYAVDFSSDDIGGDVGTCSYRNPDGPEIFALLVSRPIERGVSEAMIREARQSVAWSDNVSDGEFRAIFIAMQSAAQEGEV